MIDAIRTSVWLPDQQGEKPVAHYLDSSYNNLEMTLPSNMKNVRILLIFHTPYKQKTQKLDETQF